MSDKKGNGQGIVRPPEGFRRVGSVANAPWFNLKKGSVLLGTLQNVYERPDERTPRGTSKFFQIEAEQACEARAGRGEDAKIITVPAGSVVNLNYGPKTKELEKFVPDVIRGAVVKVWVSCGDKFKISKGRSMWDMDVQVHIVKPAQVSEDDVEFGGEEQAGSAA